MASQRGMWLAVVASARVDVTAAVDVGSKRVKRELARHAVASQRGRGLAVMASTRAPATATVDASSKQANEVVPSVVVVQDGVVPTELTASCRELTK